MKYTDRKKTPLKWHHTVSFVLMPLLLIGIAYLLLCMINELFALHISWLPVIFAPLLKLVNPGLSVTNLGSMFWPVTGAFFLTILLLILAVYVWIGFLRWKNYAKNLWLIYLLIRTVCMFAGIVLLIAKSGPMQALRMFAAFDSMSRTLLHVFYALFIVIGLWNLIFLILNLMYYHKRKFLFKADYIQPTQTSETSGSSPEAKQSDNPDSSETEKNEPVSEEIKPSDQKEQSVSDETEKEKDESPQQESEGIQEESESNQNTDLNQSEDNSTSEVKKPDQEPSEEKDHNETESDTVPSEEPAERDPNQIFCPYCGAKLGKYDVTYCSHCGRKLA